MAALSFLLTMFGKIPNPVGGYFHIGDSMLIIGVIILGTKRGALSGAIGAALSDLLGGYMIWVIPTLIFKTVWALIIGLFTYHLLKNFRYGWLVGAIVGGAVHAALYSAAYAVIFGKASLTVAIPGEIGQAAAGIAAGAIIYAVLSKSKVLYKLKAMAAQGDTAR